MTQSEREIAWALTEMLDGIKPHDLSNQIGCTDEEADRIFAARENARALLAQPEPAPAAGPTDPTSMAAWQWYSYCPEEGIELHMNRALAKAAADEVMGAYAEAADSDGWHEDMETVSWGMLVPVEQAHCVERIEAEPDSEFDEWVRYELRPFPRDQQPEPAPAAGPTDEELYDLSCEYDGEPVASMRAALERWGHQPCPYIRHGDSDSSWCALAEQGVQP